MTQETREMPEGCARDRNVEAFRHLVMETDKMPLYVRVLAKAVLARIDFERARADETEKRMAELEFVVEKCRAGIDFQLAMNQLKNDKRFYP